MSQPNISKLILLNVLDGSKTAVQQVNHDETIKLTEKESKEFVENLYNPKNETIKNRDKFLNSESIQLIKEGTTSFSAEIPNFNLEI